MDGNGRTRLVYTVEDRVNSFSVGYMERILERELPDKFKKYKEAKEKFRREIRERERGKLIFG